PIEELEYLSEAETARLLSVFNNTSVPYPSDKILISLFEEQVNRTPDRVALVFEGQSLSYSEVNAKANQLGVYLRKHYDVQPDDLIGIKLERSEWMIIALLGVLKSGGAYVPIDPAYPQERIDYMLTDSQCKVLIDEEELVNFREEQDSYNKENLLSANTSADLAYVIYTSGSTGQPKGVMIEQRSLVNYLTAINAEYGLGGDDRVLQISNFAFDASVEQIFGSLLNGAALYIISNPLSLDGSELNDFIATHGITHLHGVPALLEKAGLTITHSLKRVISAGENCPLSLMNSLKEKVTFYNKYGPTEGTISTTIFNASERAVNGTSIPIGRPINNSRIYILDDAGHLLPVGITGEICISGAGIARGYLNRAELTAEKFVADPFQPGERMYKTGDLGRWLPDGNVEYIGRKDDQVKIRGYRIELGEIENALQQLVDIDAAVVTAKGSKEKELVAYIVSKAVLNTTDIRSALGKILPSYMIPG
ncbi:amino acid adenylation domain-containing protein, partial [Chitinophaga sp. CF118]|uniref:non-ribosomal peptide synthetase n=1 Tax=Chitinophaga sp. CF118 TaxID=1884367 RepID=UPI0008DEFCD2